MLFRSATDSEESATVGWISNIFKIEQPPVEFAADGIVVGRGSVGPLRAPDRRVLVLENGGAAAMNEAKRMVGAPDMGGGNAALAHVLATQQSFKMSSAAVLAKNVDKVDPGATFPAGDFGSQLQMAARLLVGGVQVPVIKATLGGSYGMDPERYVDSKLILIWGSNPITSNLHFWTRAQEAKRRGATLVAIDPYRSLTAEKCTQHVALRPDRKSTRLNSSHSQQSRMPSSA